MRTRVLVLFALLISSPLLFAESPADYAVLRGSVTIGNIGVHGVGVVVNPPSDRAANAVRHVFRLWSVDGVKPFRTSLGNASIEYRGAELIVMDADQQQFFVLAISDHAGNTPQLPAGFTGGRFLGYGLNHELQPLANGKNAPSGAILGNGDCDFDCATGPEYANPEPTGSGGTVTCDAGGVGSTSCSVSNGSSTSCSISCAAGYYACCNYSGVFSNASCRCVRL